LLGLGSNAPPRSAQRLAILFAVGAAAYIQLKEPLFYHHDWLFSIFKFIADAVTLAVGGLIIARWFMPRAATAADPAPAGSTSDL
jgi:hypothetical protein